MGLLLLTLALDVACGPTRPRTVPPVPPVPGGGDAAALRQAVLRDDSAVARFYAARGFDPAWRDRSSALEVLRRVERAKADGLPPERYGAAAALELAAAADRGDPDAAIRFEVVVTRTWLRYAMDLTMGLIAPQLVDTLWSPSAPEADPVELLAAALATGRAAEALDELRPTFAGHAALRSTLERYRATAARGGWPALPPGEAFVPGSSGASVSALRARLAASGDLPVGGRGPGDALDAGLATAVRRFQRRHGLVPDGRVDAATLAALNTPIQTRIREIELNLERWRWLPVASGGRYLLVNAAGATLTAVDRERAIREHRVIVGRTDWPTPIVSGAVTDVVLNPSWYVPRSIVRAEIAASMAADSGYAEREGFRVYRDSGGALRHVAPAGVDWTAVEAGRIDYVVVQGPGPTNPLGRLKLVFANPFQVYLHDTPSRGSFRREDRALSHGCVRVQAIEQLAEWLLQDAPAWSRDSLARALDSGRERTIALPRPTPVYVGYWTAWVDAEGSVHHRRDRYGWDAELSRALAGADAAFIPGSSSSQTCGAIVD